LARPFISTQLRVEDYWRGVVLFGRNVATYKFALARALLELKPGEGQLVTLQELAAPFASHLCDHLKLADKQGTFQKSRFLDACRKANRGEITEAKLIEETVRLGFNNVIEAFHIVGNGEIDRRFFTDERKAAGAIRIAGSFSDLLNGNQVSNLPSEAEARWRLVETAWELGVTPALLAVSHDPSTETLFAVDSGLRRRSISGAREALSGYQKGHCFYCSEGFSLIEGEPPEVDHFFPHSLKGYWPAEIIDAVWNLVLACKGCNRGTGGKFDRVPKLWFLEKLSTRNEFLIASHHPLRETLINQTGTSEVERRDFLNGRYNDARSRLIHDWEPQERGESLL